MRGEPGSEGAGVARSGIRGEQAALTRERIVAAAHEVIAAAGIENATVDEIARTAGVGRSTVYIHFRSKAELANAIAIAEAQRVLRLWRRLAHLHVSDRGELAGWLDAFVAAWRESRSLLVLSIEHTTDQNRLAADLVDTQYIAAAEYADELDELGTRLDPRGVEKVRVVQMLIARFLYLHVSMGVPEGEHTREALLDHVQFGLTQALECVEPPELREGWA